MSETDAMSTRCAMAYTADDYDVDAHVPAAAALERLRAGNRIYVEALDHERDLSPERIADLFENGQRPFACVIACADSRVVPEHIFMAGLGELFVIRVAGNIVGPIELASVVNARAAASALAESPELGRLMAEHDLDIRCAVYHTHCGVVDFLGE